MKEVMGDMCVNGGERVVEENDLVRLVVCGSGEKDTQDSQPMGCRRVMPLGGAKRGAVVDRAHFESVRRLTFAKRSKISGLRRRMPSKSEQLRRNRSTLNLFHLGPTYPTIKVPWMTCQPRGPDPDPSEIGASFTFIRRGYQNS